MKKMFGKALALAVMMSVLAGGSVYAQTFTETVVIDGARPITLNPNGSADGNQSIEIAGPNNLLSAMGSDRFEISKEGNVVAGIYAGGLTSYGSTYESFYGASGLEISSRGALDPYMAFTANNVDVGNNVIKNVGEGDISSASSTDAVNGGQLYTALQGKVDAGTVDSTAEYSVAVGKGSVINENCNYSVAIGQNARVGSLPLGTPVEGGVERGTAVGVGAIVLADRGTALGNNAWIGYDSVSSTAIGDRAWVKDNSIRSEAIGTSAYVEDNLSHAVALGSESKATESNTVSVGNDTLKRKIINVAAGENDTDAVNFSQIKAVDGNYVKEANTVAENFTALDDQVKTNADDIATLKTDKADKSYVDTELAKKANAADVYTKSDVDTKLDAKANAADVYSKSETDAAIAASAYDDTAIKADIAKKADQTDLDTETQERKDADDKLQKQINDINSGSSAGLNELNNKINQTNDRVDRVGATAAALAGIHYQPMAKGQSQVAIGMGGYKGKKATALGLAYQFDNRISGSVAGAANGSEHMFNVGFNYLFGQHTAKDIAPMAASNSVSLKEAELQSEVDSLKAHIAKQDAEMAELKAMVKALAAK